MTTSILVPALRIFAESGPTLYPSEDGYSFVSGEAEAGADISDILEAACRDETPMTLRCGLLEVTGTLTMGELRAGRRHYHIRVQAVRDGFP